MKLFKQPTPITSEMILHIYTNSSYTGTIQLTFRGSPRPGSNRPLERRPADHLVEIVWSGWGKYFENRGRRYCQIDRVIVRGHYNGMLLANAVGVVEN